MWDSSTLEIRRKFINRKWPSKWESRTFVLYQRNNVITLLWFVSDSTQFEVFTYLYLINITNYLTCLHCLFSDLLLSKLNTSMIWNHKCCAINNLTLYHVQINGRYIVFPCINLTHYGVFYELLMTLVTEKSSSIRRDSFCWKTPSQRTRPEIKISLLSVLKPS